MYIILYYYTLLLLLSITVVTALGRKVLQEMCSVLPEDKQGPVLDNIRKMSKERRGRRVGHVDTSNGWSGASRMVTASTADRGLNGVYRSMSELDAVGEAVLADNVYGDRPTTRIVGSVTGSLMATVRAARRKQSMSAAVVYNPAFYDAPYIAPNWPPVGDGLQSTAACTDNPMDQPYLCMTSENGFKLERRSSREMSTIPDG